MAASQKEEEQEQLVMGYLKVLKSWIDNIFCYAMSKNLKCETGSLEVDQPACCPALFTLLTLACARPRLLFKTSLTGSSTN